MPACSRSLQGVDSAILPRPMVEGEKSKEITACEVYRGMTIALPIRQTALISLLATLVACHSPPPALSRGESERLPTAETREEVSAAPIETSGHAAAAGVPDAGVPDAAPPDAGPPPYDLAADLEARKQNAREVLGRKVRLAVVADVFLLVGAPPMDRHMFDRSLSLTERATAAYFNERFDRRPDRIVEVYLFPGKRSYNKYCRAYYDGCGTPYGVYFHDDRRIVMNARPGLGTLTHELVHPIIEADFPDAPDWLNEGIASLFERPSIPRPGEIHGKKNWRHPRLLRALRSRRGREFASLERLFPMSDEVFRGRNEDLGYSMARYVCQWLDSDGLLWPFYQRWRDDFAADPSGEKAFTAVVGKTPAEANPEWARWVKRL